MRLVLMLLVVVGFVAFATSLPVSQDDIKLEEIEELEIDEEPQEDLAEKHHHKRNADTSSSSSEESNEVKKPAGESKSPVAAAADTAAESVKSGLATAAEFVNVTPIAVRRKRSLPPNGLDLEENKEDNDSNSTSNSEENDPTSESDENLPKDLTSNSDENENNKDFLEDRIVVA